MLYTKVYGIIAIETGTKVYKLLLPQSKNIWLTEILNNW